MSHGTVSKILAAHSERNLDVNFEPGYRLSWVTQTWYSGFWSFTMSDLKYILLSGKVKQVC
jgi:hypothetical protein